MNAEYDSSQNDEKFLRKVNFMYYVLTGISKMSEDEYEKSL